MTKGRWKSAWGNARAAYRRGKPIWAPDDMTAYAVLVSLLTMKIREDDSPWGSPAERLRSLASARRARRTIEAWYREGMSPSEMTKILEARYRARKGVVA